MHGWKLWACVTQYTTFELDLKAECLPWCRREGKHSSYPNGKGRNKDLAMFWKEQTVISFANFVGCPWSQCEGFSAVGKFLPWFSYSSNIYWPSNNIIVAGIYWVLIMCQTQSAFHLILKAPNEIGKLIPPFYRWRNWGLQRLSHLLWPRS